MEYLSNLYLHGVGALAPKSGNICEAKASLPRNMFKNHASIALFLTICYKRIW